MQCKDILDDEFLEAVEVAAALRGMSVGMFWDVQAVLSGYPEHVGEDSTALNASLRDDLYLPFNLVRAKARKLIRKGKMDGCACGCRGDFVILGESPGEKLIRRENEKKAQNLLQLEGIARTWRIRDERLQEIAKEIKHHKKALKALKKETHNLNTYTIVTKRGNNDDVPMGQG